MSSVGPVKAALVATLRAAVPSGTVEVIYGPRATQTVVDDQIIVVGRVAGTSDYAALGLTVLTESYDVEVTCSVSMPGADTQQAATEAALALWATCNAAVIAAATADVPLGVAGVQSVRPSGAFELSEDPTEQGRAAAVRWSVHVVAV